MADGQVGFHDLKRVITVPHVERDREAVNRLNKTKISEDKHENDFQAEREEFDRMIILAKRERARVDAKEKLQVKEAQEKIKHDRDYARIFESGMDGNVPKGLKPTEDAKAALQFEEDFM